MSRTSSKAATLARRQARHLKRAAVLPLELTRSGRLPDAPSLPALTLSTR